VTSPQFRRAGARAARISAAGLLAITATMGGSAYAEDCPDCCDIQVSVFRDFAGNGVADPGIDVPQEGISITALDAAGHTYTTQTGPTGVLKLNFAQLGLVGDSVRLTLSVPNSVDAQGVPRSSYLQPAPASAAPGGFSSTPTTVKTTDGTTTKVSFGVWDPSDWTPANPDVAVPIHSALPVPGLPGALATFKFNDRLLSPTALLGNSLGNQTDLGTLGGTVYQSSQKRIFGATLAKAQTPYGNGGPGAIYSIPTDKSKAPTVFTKVTNAGTTAHSPLYPVIDPEFFSATGKEGLGDVELSDDQKTLYTINLKTRELLAFDATQPSVTAPKQTVPIPNPGCSSADDWRPYALNIHNGQLYIGGVCSAESTVPLLPLPILSDQGSRAQLKAVVQRVDWSGFKTIFSGPLDQARGQTITTLGTRPDVATHWNAWDSNLIHIPLQWSAAPALSRPQPVLSDLAFDRDGSLILGFRDRGGDQMAASPGVYTSAGDINKACANPNGTFSWEGTGTCPDHNAPAPLGQLLNGPLIGGPQVPAIPELQFPKEYFPGDWFAATHMETAQGSLAYPLRQKKIASTNMDPNMLLSSGIGWYDSETGQGPGNDPIGSGLLLSTVVTNGIGKANALGGLTLLADNAGSQVGQLVWYDADGDGTQGVGEPGLPKVTVTLLKDGAPVATTTTNRNGEYYFGDADSDLVKPGTAYTLKFDASTADTGAIPGTPAAGSLVFSPQGVGPNVLDSDADPTGTAGFTAPDGVKHDVDAGVHAP
jgi:hypothetical protein